MLYVVKEMTNFYFKSEVGLSHDTLIQLIEAPVRWDDNEDYKKSVREYENEKYFSEFTGEEYLKRLSELKSRVEGLRPFGQGFEFCLECSGQYKGWYNYCVQRTLSKEEITWVITQIKNMVGDVSIEVDGYDLDDDLYEELTESV